MAPIRRVLETIKALLKAPGALVILIVVYALLLVSVYLFISTREATVWQVLVTYALLVLIPAEFFVLQAAILAFARDRKFIPRQIVLDAIKLFVVTIPILIIGAIVWWLMNKLQARFHAPPAPIVFAPTSKPQPIHWPTMLLTTLRFVLFGVAFPLATIHLWIEATARDVRAAFAGGAKPFFARAGNALARAFASESVLIFALGLLIFFVLPYVILVPTFAIKGNKTEFAIFILRLVLAFAFMLIGWVVTIATLARANPHTEPVEISPTATVVESPA